MKWQSEWNPHVLATAKAHIDKLEKAKDVERFFPNYAKKDLADRCECWRSLIEAMVQFESGNNPSLHYGEPPPLGYDSVGLLQLSYEDTHYKKLIKLDRKLKTLEDPINNLCGGLRILATLIAKDGCITSTRNKGGSAYWSVLREKRALPSVLKKLKLLLAK